MFIAGQFLILLILGAAALFDVCTGRIPNWWILLGFGSGAVIWAQQPGFYFLRILFVTAVFFPLYYCRMTGAGDVKLMAVIGGSCGLKAGLWIIVIGFLAGAVWSLAKLLYQKSLVQRLLYLSAYLQRVLQTREVEAYYSPERDGTGVTIPFAACLFIGGICVCISGLWQPGT